MASCVTCCALFFTPWSEAQIDVSVAGEAVDPERLIASLERSLAQGGDSSPSAFETYGTLRVAYADLGNMSKAIEIARLQIKMAPGPGKELAVLRSLIASYASLNQFAEAREALLQMERLVSTGRSRKGWPQQRDWWQAVHANAKATLETQAGHLEGAEAAWKACMLSAQASLKTNPDREGSSLFVDCSRGLLGVLIATGQLSLAAQIGDQMRQEAHRVLEIKGRPLIMIRVNQSLAELAIEQGRLDQAQSLLQTTLNLIDQTEGAVSSVRAASIRDQLAQIEMLHARWDRALLWHQKRAAALAAAGVERGSKGLHTLEHAYTLVRLDQVESAVAMLRMQVQAREQVYDQSALQLWEAHAFLGVALAAAGQREEALREMRVAMPRILVISRGERSSSESGVLRAARLNWLLDGYLNLLAEFAQTDAWALDESFRIADLARGSTVQGALAASASRAHIADPDLARLARAEQDLQREASALAEAIGNLLARGRISEQDQVVSAMRATLSGLRAKHAGVLLELERRYPSYSALLSPKPTGIADIQKLLHSSEALVSIYVGSGRALVWAIAASGAPAFVVAPIDARQLAQQVQALRQSLDPNVEATGQLPPFPYAAAYDLYQALLAPVEQVWKGAQELIVVPHGRLAQLPLGVLTTRPFSASPSPLPYAEMADAPWLVKQVAISQLPAAASLPMLRQTAIHPAQHAFIGFGDPVFGAALARSAGTRGRGTVLNRRSLVMARNATPDDKLGAQTLDGTTHFDFRWLPPLPDTAEEIVEVAAALSADRERDVFLGKRASEAQLKKTDLSTYRVIMFATHGLTSGEIPGLFQPALALSNPELTGEAEDGLLTMEEILGLKLNAEWVVLSACNSAAAGAQSEESLSGLGRAFFYAGAQSLLVTNWAVETTSARLLTTGAFRRQAAQPQLSRAQALQQSSLALMRQRAGEDFSYAHPMFWAPYSLIGNGAASR